MIPRTDTSTGPITMAWISRRDLTENRDVFFLFGDNVVRQGFGGQAREMRGERNAVGIPTKWTPGSHDTDYFNDDQYAHVISIIEYDLHRASNLLKHYRVVLPQDGLGTGLSQLPQRAPRIHAYIESRLMEMGWRQTVDNKWRGLECS